MNLIFAKNIFFVSPLSWTLSRNTTCVCPVSQFHSHLPSSSYPASVWSAFKLERVEAVEKSPFPCSTSRRPELAGTYSPHTVIWTVLLFLSTLPMPATQVYAPLSHSEAFLVKFWDNDTAMSSFWMVKLAWGAPGMEHHRFRLSPWSRRVAEDSSFGLENSSEKARNGHGVRRFREPLPKPLHRPSAWPSCFWQSQLPTSCKKFFFAS